MKALLYLTVLILMLVAPELYIPSAYHALRIWAIDVVPSLFPYMVFCRLLAEQLRHTCVSPVIVGSFLGLLGGSPSGSSVLSAYGSAVPTKFLLPLVTLTGMTSPTFILHTVNRWIQNPSLCKSVLACCLFGSFSASLIVYGLISVLSDRFTAFQTQDSPENTQISPIVQSINAVLNIGGCIVIYSVVSVFICSSSMFSSHPQLASFVHALMEVSGGIHAIVSLPDASVRPYLLCAAASFSGFSILSQNAYFLRPIGIRMKHQIFLSLLRMATSVFAMCVYQCLG